ncbi:unnamed protein product [Rotaria sp. Silwood2]|nr:unnamed protein product [Rotaria sp. Silwood2]CAF3449676.1 unnamed protein product [Rotaria sp. Silwood2]CAF4277030.1 unnamed protein product [Rotaria sp. Silwood2]CAF4793981.1 unnamed protein product [Rotaria sp. Silwood2]
MTETRVFESSNSFLSFIEREPSFRNLTKDGGAAFLWYQLVAKHLCSTAYEMGAINDMKAALTAFYRDHPNEIGVSILELVVQEYRADAAIVLYTDAQYKISMILNKALKSQDLDALYNLRAYVHDLSDQLCHNEEVQLQPRDAVFHLYHGRHMSKIDLEHLMAASKGSLICINGYLSTSKSEDVAKRYAHEVLFDITYNPSRLTSVHAADVSQKSAHPLEQEVLFNLNSVFELGDIENDVNADVIPKQIIRVFLTATDKGSEILNRYIEIKKSERCENQGTTIANLLAIMGEYSKVSFKQEYLAIYS